MELKELNYLLTLAEEGNISRAAEKLFMAQSSLSHFLKQLESELNTTLFVRSSRGIRPTPSGAALIAHARNMLTEYRDARKEISDIESLQSGEIRLGISSFRGAYILPAVLKRFHAQYPGISVIITELDSIALEEKIITGSLDMALVGLPLKTHDPMLKPDTCIRDEICLIAAPTHPIMEKTYRKPGSDRIWIQVQDIAGHTFLYSQRSMILGQTARRLFWKHGIRPDPYPSDVSPLLASGLVRSGIGIALSYSSWSSFCREVNYISLDPEPLYLDLALIYPPNSYISGACRELSRFFHEYIPFGTE